MFCECSACTRRRWRRWVRYHFFFFFSLFALPTYRILHDRRDPTHDEDEAINVESYNYTNFDMKQFACRFCQTMNGKATTTPAERNRKKRKKEKRKRERDREKNIACIKVSYLTTACGFFRASKVSWLLTDWWLVGERLNGWCSTLRACVCVSSLLTAVMLSVFGNI